MADPRLAPSFYKLKLPVYPLLFLNNHISLWRAASFSLPLTFFAVVAAGSHLSRGAVENWSSVWRAPHHSPDTCSHARVRCPPSSESLPLPQPHAGLARHRAAPALSTHLRPSAQRPRLPAAFVVHLTSKFTVLLLLD